MLTKKQIHDKIIDLRKSGKTVEEIVKELHIYPQRVYAALKGTEWYPEKKMKLTEKGKKRWEHLSEEERTAIKEFNKFGAAYGFNFLDTAERMGFVRADKLKNEDKTI